MRDFGLEAAHHSTSGFLTSSESETATRGVESTVSIISAATLLSGGTTQLGHNSEDRRKKVD